MFFQYFQILIFNLCCNVLNYVINCNKDLIKWYKKLVFISYHVSLKIFHTIENFYDS